MKKDFVEKYGELLAIMEKTVLFQRRCQYVLHKTLDYCPWLIGFLLFCQKYGHPVSTWGKLCSDLYLGFFNVKSSSHRDGIKVPSVLAVPDSGCVCTFCTGLFHGSLWLIFIKPWVKCPHYIFNDLASIPHWLFNALLICKILENVEI